MTDQTAKADEGKLQLTLVPPEIKELTRSQEYHITNTWHVICLSSVPWKGIVNMTAKEYLKQIIVLDKQIEISRKHLEYLRAEAYSLSGVQYDKEPVQGGPRADSMVDKVSRLEEQSRYIDKQVEQYRELRHKIVTQINLLDNSNHIELLYLRYVEGKTFEEIAVAMSYSFRQIIRLHGSALQDFERIVLKKDGL